MTIWMWMLVGIAAGIVACLLSKKSLALGYLGTITLAVGGAVSGGYLGMQIGVDQFRSFDLENLIIPVIGAALAMMLGRMIGR